VVEWVGDVGRLGAIADSFAARHALASTAMR
jgi:hypothetical protein